MLWQITSYEDDASDPAAAASSGSFRVVGDKYVSFFSSIDWGR